MTAYKFLAPVLCAGAMTMTPLRASATDPLTSDEWRFSFMPYLWGAGAKGETAAGSDVDISFDELINNLNMAFMGNFEARKARWSVAADVIYLNVGTSAGGSVPVSEVPGVRLEVDAAVKLRAWVLNFTGGYNLLQSERTTLDLIAGARYLEAKASLDPTVRLGPFAKQLEISASGAVWDAIMGVKGDINLNNHWHVPYYLDIGTGDSDFTWQIAAGIGYKFDWGDLNLLYRYVEWDFSSGDRLDNLNFSGPMLGARFLF